MKSIFTKQLIIFALAVMCAAGNVEAATKNYNLVTNASQLVAGKKYLIVGHEGSGWYATKDGTTTSLYVYNTSPLSTSSTTPNSLTANTDNVQEIELQTGTVAGTDWLLYLTKDFNYLAGASSNAVSLVAPVSKFNAQWTIAVGQTDNAVQIICNGTGSTYSRNELVYNPANDYFRCYVSPYAYSVTMTRPFLYVEAPSCTTNDIAFSASSYNADFSAGSHSLPTITGSSTGAITYSSSVPAVASVDAATGAVTINTVGTTVITASQAADATYCADSDHYTLNVGYSVAVNSNNEALGTVSAPSSNFYTGGNITFNATLSDCAEYFTTSSGKATCELTGGDASITRSANTFTVSNITGNIAITVKFKAKADVPVTYHYPDKIEDVDYTCGASLTEPVAATTACPDWTFIGWSETEVSSETEIEPALITFPYSPATSKQLYSVFSKGTPNYQYASVNVIENNGIYIIQNYYGDDETYFFSGNIVDGIEQGTASIADAYPANYTSLPEGAMEFTFTEESTNYYYIKNGENYLGADDATGLTLGTANNLSWKMEKDDGSFYFNYNNLTNKYLLAVNDPHIGAVSLGAKDGSYSAFYLWKKISTGTTVTYISAPSCCELEVPTATEAALGNGSITAQWDAVENATGYKLYVYTKEESETELVINGGFETGDKSNWYGTASSSSTNNNFDYYSVINSDAHSGNYAITRTEPSGSGKTARLEQEITTETGKTYTFSFWYKDYAAASSDGVKNFSLVDIEKAASGSNYIDGGTPVKLSAAADWTKYEKTFTATGNTMRISIRSYEPVSIDDISVTASTEIKTYLAGYNPSETVETSKNITGLTNGTTYYYRVAAVGANDCETELSNEIEAIPSSSTGIESEQTARTIYTSGNSIVITATAGEIIEIYNVLGQPLLRLIAQNGENKIAVPNGILIVKVSGETSKVVN